MFMMDVRGVANRGRAVKRMNDENESSLHVPCGQRDLLAHDS